MACMRPFSQPQVESDIAPYKGLLMGLFFMSVGMEISAQLFIAKVRVACIPFDPSDAGGQICLG